MTDNEKLIELLNNVCNQVDPVLKDSIKKNIDSVPAGKMKSFIVSIFITLIDSILGGNRDEFRDEILVSICKGLEIFNSSFQHECSQCSNVSVQ